MMRFKRFGWVAFAVIVVLIMPGCKKSKDAGNGVQPAKIEGAKSGIPRVIDRPRALNHLKQIGLAYHNCLATTNRPPAKPDALIEYLDNDAKLTELIRSEYYVVFWNASLTNMPAGSSNTILAYEKEADADGNRCVVMGDTSTNSMSQKEFDAAAKPSVK